MTRDTRAIILQTADCLVRTRGYSAFSFADLAESAGIAKASVHHHFPSKEALALALMDDFMERLRKMLLHIDRQHATASGRLRACGDVFMQNFESGMLPFCAAMSAERSALPRSLHPGIHDVYQLELDWIRGVLEDGRKDGSFAPQISPEVMAPLVISVFGGATLTGWGLQRRELIHTAFEAVFAVIERPREQTRRRASGKPAKRKTPGNTEAGE